MSNDYDDRLCVGPHDDPRPAGAPYWLCHGCASRLREQLLGLPSLYAACELALAGGSGSTGEKVTHRKDPGLVLSLAAYRARIAIRAELVSWARIVIEERGLQVAPADTVPAMAGFVAAHVDWLAQQDYVDETARTIDETTREARAAAFPRKASRIVIGPCVADRCDGTLIAVLREDADLLPSIIRCNAERPDDVEEWQPHEWAPSQWMNLGRQIVARDEGTLALIERITR